MSDYMAIFAEDRRHLSHLSELMAFGLHYLCKISSNANHSTMTRKPVIIMITAALLMSVAAWGQSLPKFKFGEPTMEELKMTTYDKDSSAAAVVLLNLRDVGFRLDGGDITEVTTNRFRIKILKDAGKDYANVDHVLYNSTEPEGRQDLLRSWKRRNCGVRRVCRYCSDGV